MTLQKETGDLKKSFAIMDMTRATAAHLKQCQRMTRLEIEIIVRLTGSYEQKPSAAGLDNYPEKRYTAPVALNFVSL